MRLTVDENTAQKSPGQFNIDPSHSTDRFSDTKSRSNGEGTPFLLLLFREDDTLVTENELEERHTRLSCGSRESNTPEREC